jgi:hypothetical protein
MVCAASICPAAASRLKPMVAVAMASTHMRMRIHEPMFTMSLTEPMVQNRVRCMMAPNTTLSANPLHSTVAWMAGMETDDMERAEYEEGGTQRSDSAALLFHGARGWFDAQVFRGGAQAVCEGW